MNDKEDKIAFLADRLAKAKQVMKRVSENETPRNYDAPTGRQPQRQIQQPVQENYNDDEQDYVDTTQYLSEDQVHNLGGIQPQTEDLYSEREPAMPQIQSQGAIPKFVPYKNLNKTKMPSAIVESFLAKPMIDPTTPLGMESLVDQVAKKVNPQPKQQVRQPVQEQRQTKQAPAAAPASGSAGIDIQLLEFVIQKTVEATLKEISKKSNLDENIQIRIGDKTFGGKITTLKEVNKK